MQSISITELLLVIYVIVDDWDPILKVPILLQGKSGRKPRFRDSEVIILDVGTRLHTLPRRKSV